MRFVRGDVSVSVDLRNGGRLSSVVVAGRELLVTSAETDLGWGWYPMAPWAGRTRRGQFNYGGVGHQLPLHSDGHAIHGTVLTRRWRADEDGGWSCELGPDWPFSGRVTQRLWLSDDSLQLEMQLQASEQSFPAAIGWHPWFHRFVAGREARVEIPADYMLERDADGIASDRHVPVPLGPWDDTFGGLHAPVVIEYPGVLRLEVVSDCAYVVVFTEHPDGVCVEPQTAPPDALNRGGTTVEPGLPLKATMELRWTQLGSKSSEAELTQ